VFLKVILLGAQDYIILLRLRYRLRFDEDIFTDLEEMLVGYLEGALLCVCVSKCAHYQGAGGQGCLTLNDSQVSNL
jgi:hypothetical protein